MTSAHARYRQRLELVADEATLAELVGAADATRHFARFHPGRPTWAVIVLDVPGRGLVTVEISDDPHPGTRYQPGLGHVRLGTPATDPALPGLGPVVARLERARLLRYRPGSRGTLRGEAAGGRGWIVKVLAKEDDRAHLQQVQEALAAAGGALSFRVAGPGPADPGNRALWQQIVPGRPVVDELLGPDGPDLARRLGRALGELAGAPLAGPDADDPADQLARTDRAIGRLLDRVPGLGAEASGVRAALAGRHRRLRPRPAVPVHGAPHMHQWLADGPTLGLVDFDRYHRGDPELDIATLVAELETESALATSPDSIEAEAVAGFESIGRAIDPDRLDLYRLHKRLAKATRNAWALRPDGDQRAGRHLARVAAALDL